MKLQDDTTIKRKKREEAPREVPNRRERNVKDPLNTDSQKAQKCKDEEAQSGNQGRKFNEVETIPWFLA